MSTPFITPPRPQINLDSSPTPHPKPLADIQNGFADAGGRPLLAGGTRWPDPHPNAFHVMNNALKLAAAIILHPKGLEIASQIMSGSKHPNKLYPTAIRRALSLGTVIILVDHSMEPTVFGRHLHANVDDMEGDIKHRIIFVNPWVSRLPRFCWYGSVAYGIAEHSALGRCAIGRKGLCGRLSSPPFHRRSWPGA